MGSSLLLGSQCDGLQDYQGEGLSVPLLCVPPDIATRRNRTAEVAWLSLLVSEVRSTPSQDVSSAGPTVPRSYASTVSTGESNTPKPTKTNTILKSNRKFNIVIYGIGECKQGAKWPERLASA